MNPLRKLLKRFYRNTILLMTRTPQLMELFNKFLKGVTSSPVLVIFDPNKKTLLKNNRITEGMEWILMQPAYDE